MLKHVSPGDEITAEGFNSLVDAVGGPDIPTQKGFVKTGNGAIFTEWSNLDAQANMRVTDVFKCAVGPALRSPSGRGPWHNWTLPLAQTQSTEKHLYIYLGADNLTLNSITNVEKNPFLNYGGVPPKFIAWSVEKYKHIVGDIDFYVNNPDSDFNEYGGYIHGEPGEFQLAPYIYHGWIETPFQPTPGLKVYGSFYTLLNSSGEGEVAGTIFILTCTGIQNIDNTPTLALPIHSFTTFTGPAGENFIVGEQVTTPVLICEMQEPQAMPGEVEGTMESSKLVQHHTGPLSYSQIEQEAQGAWSVLNMVSGNEDGDDIEINSYFMMKLSHMSGQRNPPLPDFEIKTNINGQNFLYVNNFQASGKQVIIELDSSNPVRYGVLSQEDFPAEEETALPFVNICKNRMGFLDIAYNYDAYLVIPDKLAASATPAGLAVQIAALRGVFGWQPGLKCWELTIIQGGGVQVGLMNDVLLAECRFDGTGTYTYFVPRNHIFQGSFSNLLRDISITDIELGLEPSSEQPQQLQLKYNASIEYSNILSAVDEEGTNIYTPVEAYNKLSAAHPLGLQLFQFNKMNYTTPLSVGLTSAEISAEWIDNMDVVVRHRHFDPNNNKEGFKGSVIKYVPIKDLLSGEPQEVLCDSEISSLNLSSVQHLSTDEGQMALELFNFHELNAKTEPILSSQDVLVRELGEDSSVTLKYLPLSSISSAADVDVDAQYTSTKTPHRYSIDWMPDADNNDKVLQMYRFDESPTTYQYQLRFNDDAQIPQNSISADFVVREYYADAGGVETELNYQDGKEVVVPHEDTDALRYAQTGNGHMSINYAQGQQGEPKALQLYNFSSYGTTSEVNGLSAAGDGVLIRKKSSVDNHLELQYLNIVGLRKLVGMPSLSALDGLSVVTGIEYPMTGTNQYKIVAHRKQFNVVNNVLTITNLTDQTIDTVAHDTIYPNS